VAEELAGYTIRDLSLYVGGHQGLLANPNLMAFVGVMSAATFLTLPASEYRRPVVRWLWVGAGVVQVWLAASDAGLIYLAVVVLFAIGLRAVRASRRATPLVVLAFLLPVPLVLADSVQRFVLGLVGLTQNTTMSGRTHIWRATADAVA